MLNSELLAALTPGATPTAACLLLQEITLTSSSNFSSLNTSTVQYAPPFLVMQHFRLTLAFKPLTPFLPILYLLSLAPGCLSTPPTSFSPLTPSDFSIQKSNFNSSSSFRIPGFSALRSDHTHSRSGILSPNDTHASGGVIVLVRQGLSSEYSTSSLLSLNPYSDYVGDNISLNNSSSLSCLNVYAGPIHSSPT